MAPRTREILAKLALVLILPLAGSTAHAIAIILIACWALFGPRRAIEALTLSWLATFLNPGIYPPAAGDDMLRWLVIGAALASTAICAVRSGWKVPSAWFWVLGFVGTGTMLAFAVSYAVDVSVFKLVSFLLGVTTVLLGFNLTRDQVVYWQQWFFVLFAVIVIAGFPLIVHPLGYVRNGRGFQGLLIHPQTYTLFLGPLLAWHVGRLMTREISGPLMWLLAAIAIVSLVATKGRTGVLAAAGGTAIAGLWWLISGRLRFAVPRAWLAVGLMLVALSGAWMGFRWQTVSSAVWNFAVKGQTERSIDESFYGSRGFLLESSLANFLRHPWTGIGFGVASDPSSFAIQREPLFGLPVGASTEKGFSLVAVFEEVGLLGGGAFLLMLASVLRPVLSRRASFPATALAFGALMVNFGESVLFAVGGSGMLVWLMIGCARVTTVQKQ
jgi:hypothetical protein